MRYFIFWVILSGIISCKHQPQPNTNQELKEIQPQPTINWELRKKRAAAVTLTEFSSIGEALDTSIHSFYELKFDSIEMIDHLNEGVYFDTIPRDTILKRHKLNKEETDYFLKVVASKSTYENMIPASCFTPHMAFVFYNQDKIVAHYSVCLGCMKVYSSIDPEKWTKGIGEYGGFLFSKLCYEHDFSNCKYSRIVRPDPYREFNLR
jgi:hypothetical protein